MQISLRLQQKPNITYKWWLKVRFKGALAVSTPSFDSYFLHGLTERPLELLLLFEVRMKQTAMIEIHFLSGKLISLSLQCHPFLPYPSPLNTAPSPSPTNSEMRSCSFFCRIFQWVFFPRWTKVVRHDFIDRQVLAASVRGRRICTSTFSIAKKAICTFHSQSKAFSTTMHRLSSEYYCLVEFLNKPVSTTKQTSLSSSILAQPPDLTCSHMRAQSELKTVHSARNVQIKQNTVTLWS